MQAQTNIYHYKIRQVLKHSGTENYYEGYGLAESMAVAIEYIERLHQNSSVKLTEFIMLIKIGRVKFGL